MRAGFSVPNGGVIATVEAISKIAKRAEDLDYHTLWTFERLLYAVKPQNPYPGTADGSWPSLFRRMLDPLDTLTFLAGQTKKIFLGTSVLDIPYYNPITLARRLTTIDYLSSARLRVGLGLGWSQDEMDSTGANMKKRGPMADEFLQVLTAIWTKIPSNFRGSSILCRCLISTLSRCKSRTRAFIWRLSLPRRSSVRRDWPARGIRRVYR